MRRARAGTEVPRVGMRETSRLSIVHSKGRKTRSSPSDRAQPAQIEYRGMRGTTRPCLESLASYLQQRRETGTAILLSGPQDKYKCRSHAFLLTVDGSPELL